MKLSLRAKETPLLEADFQTTKTPELQSLPS